MRTLVLDDDAIQLKIAGKLLAGCGLGDVVAMTDASKFLSLIRNDGLDFELILLDLNMPEIDGIEVIRVLAELCYDGYLILVSAEDKRLVQTAVTLARHLQVMVIGLLQKPIDKSEFNAAVQRAMQQHSMRQGNQAAPNKSRAKAVTYTAEDLERGIAAGEMINFYQPKVRLATGKANGFEALVRWCHPQDGLVFPDQFISLAEENGLINRLTDAVLSNAFMDQRRWGDAGLDWKIAVNISMDDLKDLDFPDRLSGSVHTFGVRPESIMLEVTESRLMHSRSAVMDILTRVRLRRFGLSIDDFGTGHSTLTQLLELPFNQLKMDRSFIAGAAENRDNLAILASTIQLARQMDMEVVAEGIETLGDWRVLRDLDCDLGQGYFIARPMAAGLVADWARDWEMRRPEIIRQLASG